MRKQHVITSAELFRPTHISRPVLTRPSHGPSADLMIGRTFQALLALATLGAVLHESLGAMGAVIASCSLLPVLAALAWIALDSNYLDLGGLLPASAGRAAVLVPVLVLPSAFLGWFGVGLMLTVAVLALAL